MTDRPISSLPPVFTSLRFECALTLLILWPWLSTTAIGQGQTEESLATKSSIHATHVLGFEGERRNASGELSIQDGVVRFHRDRGQPVQLSINAIQNISLSEEDNQVGGIPMTLGKAAVPYGGGRVVSLFSHKKYDTLTIEYLDNDAGFHGAIFRMAKGQAQAFKSNLLSNGAGIGQSVDSAAQQSTPEKSSNASQPWNVQLERVDAGATTLDPCFSDAIYENLLEELAKTSSFKHVFRSGDRNANDAPGLLVLKLVVQKYTPGSETRRAVTTVTGATKLNVRVQLVAGDGHLLLDRPVEGDVRFFGDNLRATHNLAHNIAKTLKRSHLSATPATIAAERTYERNITTLRFLRSRFWSLSACESNDMSCGV